MNNLISELSMIIFENDNKPHYMVEKIIENFMLEHKGEYLTGNYQYIIDRAYEIYEKI